MRLAEIDELTVLVERIFRETEGLDKEEKKRRCIDEILDILIMAYVFGVNDNDYPEDIPVDLQKLYDSVYYIIGGETFADRISRHIDEGTWDRETMQRLVETEYHRNEEAGRFDTATALADMGYQVKKQWNTMRDERVRETHVYLEGMQVDLDEDFYTYDGDHAPMPGLFINPENNINCRCEVTYTWAKAQ